jgi:hypothetical protein
MRNGQVFELPMPTHPTSVSESSLLRSPKASEGQGGALGEAEARKRGNTVGVRDQVMDLVAAQGVKVSRASVNLPTPTASDIYTGNFSSKQHSEGSLHSVSLAQIVNRPDLLPTPIVRDYKDGQAEVFRHGKVQTDTVGRAIMNSGEVKLLPTLRASDGYERRNQKTMDRIAKDGGDMTMPTLARTTTDWGKFEPAVRLWEQETSREAPSPTKPDGKDGNHRLSSKFTEWMMGLPEGWITDVGLTRNEELKLAGNGVVPQQAELALRLLLNSDEE